MKNISLSPLAKIPTLQLSDYGGENPARFGEKLDETDKALNSIGLVLPIVKEIKYIKSTNIFDMLDILEDVTRTIDNAKKVGETSNNLYKVGTDKKTNVPDVPNSSDKTSMDINIKPKSEQKNTSSDDEGL